MRRAETIDLSTIDPAYIDLPATGETVLRDALAPRLALRFRASGTRTWVLFGREVGRTTRRTLGDPAAIPPAAARRLASADTPVTIPSSSAPLHGPEARVADVLPVFLAAGTGTRWKASTVRSMQAAADTHILPALGQRRVGLRQQGLHQVGAPRCVIAPRLNFQTSGCTIDPTRGHARNYTTLTDTTALLG